jgi:hypothetical protein
MRRFILKDGLQGYVYIVPRLAKQLRNKGWLQRDCTKENLPHTHHGWAMELTDEGKEVVNVLLKGRGKFWTGLPSGDHHNQEARLGTDFIVVEYDHGLVTYDEDGLKDTNKFIKNQDCHGWMRIRSVTSITAQRRYYDAQDQHRVWFNAPTGMGEAKNAPIVESLEKYWEGHEHLYQDVVNLPPDQRPEVIDIEEHQAGMLDDIPNTADYLRDLADRLMGVPVM